jgi:hypothetical protein
MPLNAEPIVTQIQDDMQALLTYVTGPEAARQTAATVERSLLRQLLALGAALLRLFFLTRAAERPPAPQSADGTVLRYHDQRPTTYFSIFGKLRFKRHSFRAPGQPACCPIDADLSLPERCYSDLLRDWSAYDATDGAYRETASALERFFGLQLSVHALEANLVADAQDVVAFYAQPPAARDPRPPGSILVVQADGKGVPMVQPPLAQPPLRLGKGQKRTKKKEAVVTSLYTIAPYVRSAEEVHAALLHAERPPEAKVRPQPIAKEVRASLAGKAVALELLRQRAALREGPHLQQRVALTDGAESLQDQLQERFPAHTLILDIIHASEYLWDTATALLGETSPERTSWVSAKLLLVLQGQVATVLQQLAQEAARPEWTIIQRKAIQRTMGYYERNQTYMRYDEYLAKGWPIGTGVVEGACGHLVKDRMEQAGMRWTQAGAQAMLDLRAVRLNGDWEAYWQFHQQQQHQRLYGSAAPVASPEAQMLRMAA